MPQAMGRSTVVWWTGLFIMLLSNRLCFVSLTEIGMLRSHNMYTVFNNMYTVSYNMYSLCYNADCIDPWRGTTQFLHPLSLLHGIRYTLRSTKRKGYICRALRMSRPMDGARRTRTKKTHITYHQMQNAMRPESTPCRIEGAVLAGHALESAWCPGSLHYNVMASTIPQHTTVSNTALLYNIAIVHTETVSR